MVSYSSSAQLTLSSAPSANHACAGKDDGRYEYAPKKEVTFTLTAEALVRRLAALLPPARKQLTSFHGVLAPPVVTPQL